MCLSKLVLLPIVFLAGQTAYAATISGTVTDSAGKPLQDARVDHIGVTVVVSSGAPPSFEEVRTDAKGHFQVTTSVAAIVVRKPGYTSQRVAITGDEEVTIILPDIAVAPPCRLPRVPDLRTQPASDIDYRGSWFYIETPDGREGISSGSGPMYSWGAPDDSHVWRAVAYREVMYAGGMIDASGHSADGKYWRSRSIFGASAQYYGVSGEVAEQLDCVMDFVPVGP